MNEYKCLNKIDNDSDLLRRLSPINSEPCFSSKCTTKLDIASGKNNFTKTSTVSNIEYPVRLHTKNTCNCVRIQSKIGLLKLDDDEEIIYVIEKLWDDEIFRNFPKLVYITNKNMKGGRDKILSSIFGKTLNYRKYIMQYFKKYNWSDSDCTNVRKMIPLMTTICLCQSSTTMNQTFCNSGFVIFGSKKQILKISHCFNSNIKAGEYSKLYGIRLANINNIPENNMGFNLCLFHKSDEYKQLDKNIYTLVGKETRPKNNEDVYSFSFGKLEWNENIPENSFECAKRELFEEFNIQFSKKLYNHSSENNQPQYLYDKNLNVMLYFLYIDTSTNIFYHKKSETILLDM